MNAIVTKQNDFCAFKYMIKYTGFSVNPTECPGLLDPWNYLIIITIQFLSLKLCKIKSASV